MRVVACTTLALFIAHGKRIEAIQYYAKFQSDYNNPILLQRISYQLIQLLQLSMGACASKKDSSQILIGSRQDRLPVAQTFKPFSTIDAKQRNIFFPSATPQKGEDDNQTTVLDPAGGPFHESTTPQKKPTPMILDVKMKKGENVMSNFLIDLTEIANSESISNQGSKKLKPIPSSGSSKKTMLHSKWRQERSTLNQGSLGYKTWVTRASSVPPFSVSLLFSRLLISSLGSSIQQH
ncbi:hypothetical protein FGO68_gene789 [Halteria grandinella]|uniref:Uncharacterized protein n=1 Tax=Halteria grandinella TaxID=5974 RepID=A0A8J8T949_HALGN|nr:hypothetical protein FGO68_gene789 [Halteria grandinella]